MNARSPLRSLSWAATWSGVCVAAAMACSGGSHDRADEARGPVAAWQSVDPAFDGCQGTCGAHLAGPQPDVVVQPGAAVGQRTYCPVSGAVFTVDASRPHVDVDGQRLWFCCRSCADYFAAHRDRILAARGVGARAERDAPGRPSIAAVK